MATRIDEYKIVINIKNQDGEQFIIDDMCNILLEEFKEKNNVVKSKTPLLMIRDQYYIDDKVLSRMKEIYNKEKRPYEYFINSENIIEIFNSIRISNEPHDIMFQRITPLNNYGKQEQIVKDYVQYVFPNKTKTSQINPEDREKILLFYNVLYIIQNIYLIDDTIVKVHNISNEIDKQDDKKYYISEIKKLDLKTSKFQIEKGKVTIYLQAKTRFIFEYPILKIQYLIDDIEKNKEKFKSLLNNLEPKDISDVFSKYNSIYIDNTIKYSDISIYNFFNSLDIQKIIGKNKDLFEIFLNPNVMEKFTEAQAKKEPKEEEAKIVTSNIKYLLYNILKLYNSKPFKNYFIDDTFIAYINKAVNTYYSIATKKDLTQESNKYNNVITDNINTPKPIQKEEKILFKQEASLDNRLEKNITYYIYLVFKCYKSDDTGKKPSFKRRFIAEQCLNRAQVLDNVFSKLFYDTLSLPKNYLYLKLTNLKTREIPLEKAPSDQERNQERNEERNQERNYDKRGGTKKYSIYNKKTRKR